MRKLVVGSIVLAFLLVSSGLLLGYAGAAERARPIRIGALTDSWGPTPQVAGLRDGLVELGYREHEDFVLGVRFTQGDLAALFAAARDLVQNGLEIIFADGDHAAKAAQRATTRIPIVFVSEGNPVEQGLIQSFAQPGSNITGVSDLRHELNSKRLEVFRQIVSGLKRVLYVYAVTDTLSVTTAKNYRDAARQLGIVLVEQPVRTEAEAKVQATLDQLRKNEMDGILIPLSPFLNIPGSILEAIQRTIPTMFGGPFWVERGGLASYGPNQYETGRQAARLMDKIIKGADPGEIPVEVNSKIEFVINLKTAKALGLTIAPEVLYQADRLIR